MLFIFTVICSIAVIAGMYHIISFCIESIEGHRRDWSWIAFNLKSMEGS